MRVETRVSELSDLLCQKFDSVGGVAEDDGLVDLELRTRWRGEVSARKGRKRTGKRAHFGEESVEAVDLLTFLDESVVLGDSSKGELVHEVDLVGLDHVLVLKTRRMHG